MKLLKELLLLLAVGCFFFIIDKNRCGKADTLLFVHHVICSFSRFWWLSNNLYMLLFFAVSPMIYYMFRLSNQNRCFITLMHNKECVKPADLKFNDVFGVIGLNKMDWWENYGYKIFLLTSWLFVMYKITNRRKWKLDM